MPKLDDGSSWEWERLLEALEAYRMGASEPPLLRKWSEGNPLLPIISPHAEGPQGGGKAGLGDSEAGPGHRMSFVVSTDEVDRHGDVIAVEGWQLESYLRNPVFLWAHNYTRPVIGRALEVGKEPQRLLARLEFAPTDFAQEVARLYQGGYQRGVSVGFKPLKYEERRHQRTGAFLGIRFLEQELLEVSAVPVPANRSALQRALEQAPRVGEYLRRLEGIGEPAAARPSGGASRLESYLEGVWPGLASRVDDIGKLVEELAQMLGDIEIAGRRGPGRAGMSAGVADGMADGVSYEVAEVLAALREARGG